MKQQDGHDGKGIGDGGCQGYVHVHRAYITRTSHVHHAYITCTSRVHHLYVVHTSCAPSHGWKVLQGRKGEKRSARKSERQSVGASECRSGARESRNVGGSERSGGGQEGVPLTITPPLERHRPDAWTEREIGRKGIEPKVIAWIRRGAAVLR